MSKLPLLVQSYCPICDSMDEAHSEIDDTDFHVFRKQDPNQYRIDYDGVGGKLYIRNVVGRCSICTRIKTVLDDDPY
jgi:hypothetical protein